MARPGCPNGTADTGRNFRLDNDTHSPCRTPVPVSTARPLHLLAARQRPLPGSHVLRSTLVPHLQVSRPDGETGGRVVMASSHPVPGDQPEFVVEQPLAGPRQDRVG